MAIQYVHTFVFACPACHLPIAVSRVSGEQTFDGPMRVNCGYCGKASYVSSNAATQHYIEEWQRTKEASQG